VPDGGVGSPGQASPLLPTEPGCPDPPSGRDRWLLATLQGLRAVLQQIELERAGCLEAIHPRHRAGARNLLHTIAFHGHVHPDLARALRRRGLCPLTEGDPQLLVTMEAVITALEAIQGPGPTAATAPGQPAGPDRRTRHGDRRCGTPAFPGGAGRLVTLPAEAAERPALIAELLAAGMTIARIDGERDNPAVWRRMAEALGQARVATGRPCAIAMAPAGPKLRIGPLAPQPAVIRARPPRDRMGRPTQPVRILAVPPGSRPAPQDPEVVLLPARLSKTKRLKAGVRLRGRDASGRRRTLTVVRRGPDGVLLRASRTCRFVAGLVFRQHRGRARLVVGPLAPVAGERLLKPGDTLRLTPEPDRGAGTLPCGPPEVLPDLRPGERVFFGDGRSGGVIRAVSPREVVLEVTTARTGGSRLRSGMGMHVPDSDLRTPTLTAGDIDGLACVSPHADMIICDFLHRESDIQTLRRGLEARGRGDLAVVLTIGSRQALLNLPQLLLAAMAHGAPLGVMVAPGDLAITCGREAVAPVQQEILRICAAAHVPCLRVSDPRRSHLKGLEIRSIAAAGEPLP
jgi:pyruvate kinase